MIIIIYIKLKVKVRVMRGGHQNRVLYHNLIIKVVLIQVKTLKEDQEHLEKTKDESKQVQDGKRAQLRDLKAINRFVKEYI